MTGKIVLLTKTAFEIGLSGGLWTVAIAVGMLSRDRQLAKRNTHDSNVKTRPRVDPTDRARPPQPMIQM